MLTHCPQCKRYLDVPIRSSRLCEECESLPWEQQMINWCRKCNGSGFLGWIPRWEWLVDGVIGTWFEQFIAHDCEACGGDGYAKPPGWPDENEMQRLTPSL